MRNIQDRGRNKSCRLANIPIMMMRRQHRQHSNWILPTGKSFQSLSSKHPHYRHETLHPFSRRIQQDLEGLSILHFSYSSLTMEPLIILFHVDCNRVHRVLHPLFLRRHSRYYWGLNNRTWKLHNWPRMFQK